MTFLKKILLVDYEPRVTAVVRQALEDNPHRDQDGRVPRGADARRRARAGRARPRGAGPGRRRRGLGDPGRRATSRRAREIVARRRRGVRGRRDDRQGQGAAAGARSRCCAPRHMLFTYLHLAPDPELTQGLVELGRDLRSPTRRSTDAARPAAAAGADERGRGQDADAGRRVHAREAARRPRACCSAACPGVAAGKVMIIGGGVVGMNAAEIAVGMGAEVYVFDRNIDRLRELDVVLRRPRVDTCYAIDARRSSSGCRQADLVIGAVLVHGAKAPQVVTARPARADEAERGAGRRRRSTRAAASRPRARRPTPTRPTRSTASPTTAWPTCPARCRSRRPSRSPTRRCRTCCTLADEGVAGAARENPGLARGQRRRRQGDLRARRRGDGPALHAALRRAGRRPPRPAEPAPVGRISRLTFTGDGLAPGHQRDRAASSIRASMRPRATTGGPLLPCRAVCRRRPSWSARAATRRRRSSPPPA